MTVTFTSEELAKLVGEVADWYNAMSIYVLENMATTPDYEMRHWTRGGAEAYHKWCKKYQEEHPKPNWKDLLP
jgi:hypothetical protein